jgi:hypothetical protein
MSERPFGSLSPQEAQAKSVEARRRNKEALQATDLIPEQKIEAAMQKKAIGGDVNAAREYREWLKINRAAGAGGINGDILRAVSDRWGKAGLDTLNALVLGADPADAARAAEDLELLGPPFDSKTDEWRQPSHKELERQMKRGWDSYCSARKKLGLGLPPNQQQDERGMYAVPDLIET